MSDVLPSPLSVVTITIAAIIGINIMKAAATKWPFLDFGGVVSNT